MACDDRVAPVSWAHSQFFGKKAVARTSHGLQTNPKLCAIFPVAGEPERENLVIPARDVTGRLEIKTHAEPAFDSVFPGNVVDRIADICDIQLNTGRQPVYFRRVHRE